MEYDVAWRTIGLGGSGSDTITDGSTEYLYETGLNVLVVGIELRVQPRIGDWAGDEVGYRAAIISLLGIPIRVECDRLLGIL